MGFGGRSLPRLYAARHGVSIVVASMGRSGSTLLTQAVASAAIGPALDRLTPVPGRRLIRFAVSLTELQPQRGLVYKTHALPVSDLPPDCRTIYVYADPYDVVASLHHRIQTVGEQWMQNHAVHLVGHDVDTARLFDQDIYELERNFDAWMQSTAPRTLLIRYDMLWRYQPEFGSFLGFPVTLPPYRPRQGTWQSLDDDIQTRLKATYGQLRDRVMASDFAIR